MYDYETLQRSSHIRLTSLSGKSRNMNVIRVMNPATNKVICGLGQTRAAVLCVRDGGLGETIPVWRFAQQGVEPTDFEVELVPVAGGQMIALRNRTFCLSAATWQWERFFIREDTTFNITPASGGTIMTYSGPGYNSSQFSQPATKPPPWKETFPENCSMACCLLSMAQLYGYRNIGMQDLLRFGCVDIQGRTAETMPFARFMEEVEDCAGKQVNQCARALFQTAQSCLGKDRMCVIDIVKDGKLRSVLVIGVDESGSRVVIDDPETGMSLNIFADNYIEDQQYYSCTVARVHTYEFSGIYKEPFQTRLLRAINTYCNPLGYSGLQLPYDQTGEGKRSVPEIQNILRELLGSAQNVDDMQTKINDQSSKAVGMDCSGMVFQCLDYATYGKTSEILIEAFPEERLAVMAKEKKPLNYYVNAQDITHNGFIQNEDRGILEITRPADARVGDLVYMYDAKEKERHVVIFYDVTPQRILYAHSSASRWGSVKGPHKGTINIINPEVDIKSQDWVDKGYTNDKAEYLQDIYQFTMRPSYI